MTVYVVMPNQLGLDQFDLEDALGEQKEYMCSADMREFIQQYHLDLSTGRQIESPGCLWKPRRCRSCL